MNTKYKILLGCLIGALLVPAVASAQAQNILAVIDVIAIILNRVVAIVIILAMIWFVWGLMGYIAEGSEDSKAGREKGRERMIMGTIAFFV
ncbi:MAG: hypothetical protein COV10_01615, partial [Candidatus Vogelbacteria bacterium CG10_big_fil_rev_8_21_14_0_10_51_16]